MNELLYKQPGSVWERDVLDSVNAHIMPYVKCGHMHAHMYVVIVAVVVVVSYVAKTHDCSSSSCHHQCKRGNTFIDKLY